MIASAKRALAEMVSFRQGFQWGQGVHPTVAELTDAASQLCANISGPRVKIELPVAVLATAISYVFQMEQRTPRDGGYCQWPVSHAGEWGDGTCGRTGYGSRLPVCHQHEKALVDAVCELFDDRRAHLEPYAASKALESLSSRYPDALDQLLLNKIHLYSSESGCYDRLIGRNIAAAIDGVIESRLAKVWCA